MIYFSNAVLHGQRAVEQTPLSDICPNEASRFSDFNGRRVFAVEVQLDENRARVQRQETAAPQGYPPISLYHRYSRIEEQETRGKLETIASNVSATVVANNEIVIISSAFTSV